MYEKTYSTLEYTEENPFCKSRICEYVVLLTDIVKSGVIFSQEILFFNSKIFDSFLHLYFISVLISLFPIIYIFLENSPYNDGPKGEDTVIESDIPVVENALRAEHAIESKIKLRQRKNHIFIKKI